MIDLPYPPPMLNPNRNKGRHWATISKARKRYRRDCLFLIRPQIRQKGLTAPDTPLIRLRVEFRPPIGEPSPDDDNIISAFKVGRDALAEAFGIDDKRFRTDPVIGSPAKNGAVLVSLHPLTEEP